MAFISPGYLEILSTRDPQWPHLAEIPISESHYLSCVQFLSFQSHPQPSNNLLTGAPAPSLTLHIGDSSSWLGLRVLLALQSQRSLQTNICLAVTYLQDLFLNPPPSAPWVTTSRCEQDFFSSVLKPLSGFLLTHLYSLMITTELQSTP